MKRNLNEILEDLFMIDPSLKKQKKDVSRIVRAMVEAQPDTKFDQAFAIRLKNELLAEAGAETSVVSSESPTKVTEQTRFNFAQAMQKWIYGFGGAAVALAVVVAIISADVSTPIVSLSSDQSAFKPQVVSLPGKAFGMLASADGSSGAVDPASVSATRESAAAPVPAGLGGGGFAGSNPVQSGDLAIDSKMIAPNPITYNFVYKGETLVLDQTQGDVFKRLKGDLPSADMVANLRSMNLGLADLGSFDNIKLMMLQLAEDKPNGLSITVDMNEESLSMYQNWLKWEYNYNQQPGGTVPADEELIRIANEFVRSHGLDTSAYGEPVVDYRWRQYYIMTETPASEIYTPMEMTVRYPLLLNGQNVREQYGDEYGMFVNINTALKKVAGVNNLTTQRYEKSSYDLETDAARILKVAEQGGNQWYWRDENAEVVEIGLGTPSLVYMRHWQFDGKSASEFVGNTSSELYVPALYFPITEKPEGVGYYQDGVTVPLAKDILAQYGQTPEVYPTDKPLPAVLKTE